TLVMLSALGAPESEAVARSGLVGAAGAALSIVTDRPPEAAPVLPAASVAVAVIVWLPEASVEAVMLQSPVPSALPLPTTVVPSVSYSVMVLPASAVPVKVGVATLVRLSVLDEPESEAAARSGAKGAPGAVVSRV